MERTELPVAIFDSGLGGISVLRALVQRMPGEDFLYFGDSANAPYGVRPAAEVRELTQSVIARLYARGIKAAVIACNTATSAAIGTLRAAFSDIPVIGIEPALKPAAAQHRHVLVLASCASASVCAFICASRCVPCPYCTVSGRPRRLSSTNAESSPAFVRQRSPVSLLQRDVASGTITPTATYAASASSPSAQ